MIHSISIPTHSIFPYPILSDPFPSPSVPYFLPHIIHSIPITIRSIVSYPIWYNPISILIRSIVSLSYLIHFHPIPPSLPPCLENPHHPRLTHFWKKLGEESIQEWVTSFIQIRRQPRDRWMTGIRPRPTYTSVTSLPQSRKKPYRFVVEWIVPDTTTPKWPTSCINLKILLEIRRFRTVF